VRFWEDLWFGSCSLAIQFWDLYSIINEQGCTVRDAWNGVNLKFTEGPDKTITGDSELEPIKFHQGNSTYILKLTRRLSSNSDKTVWL
jgi:hypothetical protein